MKQLRNVDSFSKHISGIEKDDDVLWESKIKLLWDIAESLYCIIECSTVIDYNANHSELNPIKVVFIGLVKLFE